MLVYYCKSEIKILFYNITNNQEYIKCYSSFIDDCTFITFFLKVAISIVPTIIQEIFMGSFWCKKFVVSSCAMQLLVYVSFPIIDVRVAL